MVIRPAARAHGTLAAGRKSGRLCFEMSCAAAEKDIVGDIKEKRCCITLVCLTAENSDKESTNAPVEESIIPVGAERFRYAEVLSQASSIGKEASGTHAVVCRDVVAQKKRAICSRNCFARTSVGERGGSVDFECTQAWPNQKRLF